MKIRQGFVSNSSSSSFVCDVCKENVSGMDMGLSDAEMFECVVGHVICDSHELTPKVDFYDLDLEGKRARCLELAESAYANKEQIQSAEYEQELDNIYSDELSEEDRYAKSKDCCPCCQLKRPSDDQVLEFLLADRKSTREDVVKQMQERFKDYDEMCKELSV